MSTDIIKQINRLKFFFFWEANLMKQTTIPGVEKAISQLFLGSMVFSPDGMDFSFSMLDQFFDAGGNAIDTAHGYGGGGSEITIGTWMATRNNRSDVFILDKGGHPNGRVPRPRLSPEELERDIRESLTRLRTDYIDLYVLHRDDPGIPVSTIVEFLNQEIGAGRLRAIGASNWEHHRIQGANDYAAEHGLHGFVASSSNLSLAVPIEAMWAGVLSVSQEAWHWHRETQFPLMPWSAQARGFFSGAFTPENQEDENMVRVYYNDDNFERLRRAQALGEQRGASAIQIALAYVLHQPFPIFPLIGPRTPDELTSSLGGMEIELSDEQVRWLNLED
jgi:aryl-alcohol dehydrogenase-like predicted oxidoreductase